MRPSLILFFVHREFAFSIGKFPSHFTLASNMGGHMVIPNSAEESFEDLFEESFGTIIPPLTEKQTAKLDLARSKSYVTQTSIKQNVAPMPGFLVANGLPEIMESGSFGTGMKSGKDRAVKNSCEERVMERELHLCGYDGIGLADCVTAIAKQLGQECLEPGLSDYEGSGESENFSEYACALSNSNVWIQWRSWTVYSLKYHLALNCGIADSNNDIDKTKVVSVHNQLKENCQKDLSKSRESFLLQVI